MTRFFKYWLPVVIWAGVIFWFSSQTTPQASNVYWQEFAIKKFAHIVIFGILAGFIYRALRSHKITAKNSALLAIVIASVYGLSDEFHQSFTPGREPTLRDVFF